MFHSALLGAPDSLDRRKSIRSHIKMVMEQLEKVLCELKDVARELKQVLVEIDQMTAYIGLNIEEDIEDDNLSLACSRNSSKRTLGSLFKVEANSSSNGLTHLLHNSPCNSTNIKVPALYRRSCGDLPTLNGPIWPSASWIFGRRDEMYSGDRAEHHALCCDDDDFSDAGSRKASRFSSSDSVFSSSAPKPLRLGVLTPRSVHNYHLSPDTTKKAMRSCSTQTVSDKSTQTSS